MRLYKKKKQPTIKQFQELVLLEREGQEKGLEKEVRFAAIMEGMPYLEARERLTLRDLIRINQETDISPDIWDPKAKLPRYFWIKGRLFRVCRDFTAMSFGEFAAFEHFTRTPDSSIRELHNTLALLTREVSILRLIWPWRRSGSSWGKVRRDAFGRLQDPERLPEEAPREFLERAIWLQDNAPVQAAAMVSAFFLQLWNETLRHISRAGKRPTWIERWRALRKRKPRKPKL